ncbi:heterokaryon incompatibility protein [Colletotrichum sojae]|uniref:Heterokaryon incompatibility protein n=1 Tax=Colletotrichum sojae TaxID=2175907 RepID=A0A8H6MKZ2_9PEZI|nr:heterokaryon incompatibility protein [Colletotrichum sojae]
MECICLRPDIITAGGITSCMGCGGVPAVLGPTSPSTSSRTVSPEPLPPSSNSPRGTSAEFPDELVASDHMYQALGAQTDIRLLTLEPGEFDDPVRSALSLGSTSGRDEYDAISYTWGGEDNIMAKTGRISVNSQEFSVTPNCETALRRMRLRWSRRTVWIDAICIDQDDVNERGHQVLLIPQIYSRARQVVIYTGEALPEDEQLLCLLSTGGLNPDSWFESKLRLALLKFFSRRYFSRVWILPEVAMARRAVLLGGGHSIPWSSFQVPQLLAQGLLEQTASRDNLPSVIHFQAPKYRDSSNLLQLLDQARPSHATDPRDKVFALFGLLSGAKSDGFHADYTLSVKDVFLRIAEWIVQRHGILALLIRCVSGNDTDDEELSSALRVRAKITNADLEGARSFMRFANEVNLRGEELKKRFSAVVECEADAGGLERLMGIANEGNLDDEDLGALLFPRTHHTLRTRKLPSWAPDWTFRQSTTVPDALGWGDINPQRVRLPVKILAGSDVLQLPVLRVGTLVDELASRSRSEPWSYWSLGGKLCSGPRLMNLRSDFQPWRFPRWAEDHVYLVPRPDEYGHFSFEEPGEVSVHADGPSLRWIHKSPEGTETAGYFSPCMISGIEVGVGLVCLRGLLQLSGMVAAGEVWKTGYFEQIGIASDDVIAGFGPLGSDWVIGAKEGQQESRN